jgi:hypothetical protein
MRSSILPAIPNSSKSASVPAADYGQRRQERQGLILTTDVHLPRRIGHTIVDAYKGELDTHYDEEGHFIRTSWKRDS